MKTKNLFLTVVAILGLTTANMAQNVPSYVPTDGLVGWWPFNGNANDESGNGHDGVVNGPSLTGDRFGGQNAAYKFDGDDDLVWVNNTFDEEIDSSVTISMWYLMNQTNDHQSLFLRQGFNGTKTWILHITGENTLRFYNDCCNYSNVGGPYSLYGSWQNITVVFSKFKVLSYFNGKLVGTEILSSPFAWTNDIIMFGESAGTGNSSYPFLGKLDDIGIWNRALTPEEVEQLYTGEVKKVCLPEYVPADGLVGWWPFCGNANDESGNGNDGVVNGATLTEDRFGKKDEAYAFNGFSNYINVDTLHFNSFTLTGWYKITTLPIGSTCKYTYAFISNHNHYPALPIEKGIEIGYSNSGVMGLGFQAGDKSSPIVWNFDGIPTDFGDWKFFALSYDSTTKLTILYDGLRDTSVTKMDFSNLPLRTYFGARPICDPEGGNNPGFYLNGKLDDIGIWNRALTPQEIKDLYYGASPYSCAVDSLLNPTINYGSVTDIDGNKYPTVKIGEQEWMADNLRTTRYQNGAPIPNVTDNNEWINLKTGAWSYYNNDSTLNCPYGKLYNWYAASNPNNVCPSGWRLPTFNESELLFGLYLGGIDVAGGKMKSQKIWDSSAANTYNSSGFSGLPGGYRSNRDGGGYFSGLGNQGWWHINYNETPSHRNLYIDRESVNGRFLFGFYNHFSNETGVSIRCIKESDPCELIGNIVPLNLAVKIGEQVTFDGQVIVSEGTSFRWQANTASTGWTDINPSSVAYSGQNSNQLIVKNISLSNHMQEIRLVANNGICADTSNVSKITVVDTCIVTITDTIITTITDTILTTVTDTLLIDVLVSTGQNPLSNLIRVYPNPTSTHLIIDAGQYTLMTGYTLTVTSAAGALVWTQTVSEPIYTLDLSTWGGTGLYFITLKDPQGNVVTTRKIVVQ